MAKQSLANETQFELSGGQLQKFFKKVLIPDFDNQSLRSQHFVY